MSQATDTVLPVNGGAVGGIVTLRRHHRGAFVVARPYLYILPGLIIYVAFVTAPILQGASYSLYQWDGVTDPAWVGFNNYLELFTDPLVIQAFEHTALLFVFYCIIPIALGLPLASVLGRIKLRGAGFFRTVLFLPQVVATVVIAVAWRWVYSQDGPLNAILRLVGLGRLARAWLGDFSTALPAIGLVGAWTSTGLCTVIFMVAVSRIPTELYEAARLDGATPLQEFFAVTLPAARQEITVAATLTTIAALRTFDLVYVATTGGPGNQTIVPGLIIYQRAFRQGNVGSAAAIAVTLAVVLIVISQVITHFSDRKEADT